MLPAALSVRSMAVMGSHRTLRPHAQLASANSARHRTLGVGHRSRAAECKRRPVTISAWRGLSPVRPTRKLTILITGVVIAVAAVIAFAATAAAHRSSAPGSSASRSSAARSSASHHATSATAASQPNAGGHAAAGHGATPVSAGLGLAPGVVSPSAAGIAEAMAVLPSMDTYQLAGQRVIYSYSGLTPPASLLWAISHGRVAGIIFFKGNVGTTAHLTAVIKQLQTANAASTNPVRLPLLMMTDQEGGVALTNSAVRSATIRSRSPSSASSSRPRCSSRAWPRR